MQSIDGNESIFDYSELFFSRTNERGTIISGNSVFQRVSEYPWEQLLQKPHSLIRHPAMPRGVFYLLWDTITARKPIGAYVVNKSKTGNYYWVFALVTPIDGGYLSIRLKPSSPVFQLVQKKYQELLSAEKIQKLTPQASSTALLKEIIALGFADYTHFMTEALMQELQARQEKMNKPSIQALTQIKNCLNFGDQLEEKSEEVQKSYSMSSRIPLNLEIQATRIGEEASTIATISNQYDNTAREIQTEIKKFLQAAQLVKTKLYECQFSLCNSILQNEMYHFFKIEPQNEFTDTTTEMGYLEQLSTEGLLQATQSLKDISEEYSKFRSVFEEVRKLSTTLDIVNLSGKIEAAKMNQNSEEITDLLNSLGQFKNSLKKSLGDIDHIGWDLISQTQEIYKTYT